MLFCFYNDEPKTTFRYLDLLHTRPLEPQVEAVVGERADLRVVAVVTHADDRDLGAFDQTDHLLHALHIRQIIVNGFTTTLKQSFFLLSNKK